LFREVRIAVVIVLGAFFLRWFDSYSGADPARVLLVFTFFVAIHGVFGSSQEI
jgi:hypothetical protein